MWRRISEISAPAIRQQLSMAKAAQPIISWRRNMAPENISWRRRKPGWRHQWRNISLALSAIMAAESQHSQK